MRLVVNGRRVSPIKFAATGTAGLAVVAVFLLVAALGVLLTAWILMLLLGAVHHSLWAAVPALGFWQCVLVAMVLNFITSLFK